MNKTKIFGSVLVMLVLTASLVASLGVDSISAENFSPGEEQEISLKIKNNLDEKITDVSVDIDNSKIPFVVTSSEEIDEIDDDDSEKIDMTIKAVSGAEAGDYSVPYTLYYKFEDDEEIYSKEGIFVLTIEANPDLAYTITTEKPIIGNQGKIKLTIVNKGLGDAKFVNVKINPKGFALLSASEDYIGTISSDDFETVTFNVIFDDKNPVLSAVVDYKNFDNEKVSKSLELPVTVYSREEALKLGMVKNDNTMFYIVGAVLGAVGFFVIKKIRKKRKQNKMQGK